MGITGFATESTLNSLLVSAESVSENSINKTIAKTSLWSKLYEYLLKGEEVIASIPTNIMKSLTIWFLSSTTTYDGLSGIPFYISSEYGIGLDTSIKLKEFGSNYVDVYTAFNKLVPTHAISEDTLVATLASAATAVTLKASTSTEFQDWEDLYLALVKFTVLGIIQRIENKDNFTPTSWGGGRLSSMDQLDESEPKKTGIFIDAYNKIFASEPNKKINGDTTFNALITSSKSGGNLANVTLTYANAYLFVELLQPETDFVRLVHWDSPL